MAYAAGTDPQRAPTLSLIMTVRDGARFVAQAIASVRAQTFTDWELVLWDDGSTDATLAVARDAAGDDERVVIVPGAARGRRAALVDAHARARGRYLGWLDADDWLAPEALERAHEVLVRTGCDLVYTDHVIVDDDGKRRAVGRRSQIPYSARRLLVDFITFHFRLFSRDVFERAGGIGELEIAIDYDLCLRIAEHGRITYLAEPLYFYREHDAQLSTTKQTEQIDASARAIRAAIARRRLPYRVFVDPRGSFRLVPMVARDGGSTLERIRTAVATFVPAARPAQRREVRVVASWPPVAHSVYRDALTTAADRIAIGTTELPGALPALMRVIWTGRAGDVLVIHGIAPLLHAPDRGTALARCHLFVRTVDHARARGMRVIWITPGPLTTHARYASVERWCRQALARRCDAILTHWEADLATLRALGGGDRAAFAPHPDLAHAYPQVSRAYARETLGIPADAEDTTLVIGDGEGLVLAADIEARNPRDVAFHLAAADRVVFSSDAAITASALAVARGSSGSWDAVLAAVVG